MTEQPVLVEARPNYRILNLTRPARLNAVTTELHRALADALDKAEADKTCRSILITGSGRGFCAGQDLSDIDPPQAGKAPDLGLLIDRHYNPLIRRLRAFPMPVVCAVNGVAAGAGANIALACDIVRRGALGEFPAGLRQDRPRARCRRHAGSCRGSSAKRARAGSAMLAEPLSAETGRSWGLIWKCVDDDELMERGAGDLRALRRRRRRARLALTKRALEAAATNRLDAQLDLERDLQREAGRGATMPRASPPSSRSAPKFPARKAAHERQTRSAIARACAEAMWADDTGLARARHEVERVAPGEAAICRWPSPTTW